jgi:hypothetical protein
MINSQATETIVRQRYSIGARGRADKLCCPADYETVYRWARRSRSTARALPFDIRKKPKARTTTRRRKQTANAATAVAADFASDE